MDDQRTGRESGDSVKWITSTPRERILAGVLFLVYIGGWALARYSFSIRLEDHWPARVFLVVFATWFAIMLVLPLVAVCWFFGGIAGSPAWFRGRFSLRTLLIGMTLVAVALGVIVAATWANPAPPACTLNDPPPNRRMWPGQSQKDRMAHSLLTR